MPDSTCLVRQAAERYGDLAAIIGPNRTLSFVGLGNAVTATANKLAKKTKPGERIGIVVSTSIELIVLLHAIWRVGAIACPLNSHIPSETIKSMLKQIGCHHVIANKDSNEYNTILLEELVDLNTRPASRDSANIDYSRPATLVFTSGTSAEPKAACHSYANHYYSALSSNEIILINRSDRWLLSLPLFHVGGLAILFRTLLSGAALVLPDENESLTDIIDTQRVSHLSLVSTQLHRLLSEKKSPDKLQSLKALLVGGGPVPKDLIKKAHTRGLPLYLTYGLTEMSSQVTTTRPNASLEELETSGTVLSHGEFMINSNGEILVRGSKLFLGYYKSGSIVQPVDPNGWFHTGDHGFIDKKNHLHLLGRIDNMFICGGENIQPEEIEKEIIAQLDTNRVIVVPVDDSEFGQRPVAIIDGEFEESDLLNQLRLRLSGLKIPIAFLPWPAEIKSGLKVSRIEMACYAKDQLTQ